MLADVCVSVKYFMITSYPDLAFWGRSSQKQKREALNQPSKAVP
jgi:hypothetical protein